MYRRQGTEPTLLTVDVLSVTFTLRLQVTCSTDNGPTESLSTHTHVQPTDRHAQLCVNKLSVANSLSAIEPTFLVQCRLGRSSILDFAQPGRSP